MCGRFALVTPVAELKKRFDVKMADENLSPHFNVAPGKMMPIIPMTDAQKMIYAKWGLVPHWAKDEKIGYKMINARAETITEKPSYRDSFRTQRCLVLADGFYEWDKKSTEKKPYYISLKDKEPFAFAGIYSHWKGEGRNLISFSIITTEANDLISKIHERMPIILERENEKKWLDTSASEDQVISMLDKYQDEKMMMYEVTKLVNNPRNDIPEIIEAV
jgi:putative SOS response-associated peptidase YedK